MVKLEGRVSVKRLYGEIYRVPGSAGGGPLQAKTVYPSHSEQIIAPDDDFYGLALVTVKPTPRLPACVTSMGEGTGDIWYGEGAYITAINGVELSITAEDVTEEETE